LKLFFVSNFNQFSLKGGVKREVFGGLKGRSKEKTWEKEQNTAGIIKDRLIAYCPIQTTLRDIMYNTHHHDLFVNFALRFQR
jgi:hypothetical protein